MIKINDSFSISKYTYGWELHHTTPSTDKDGNESTSTRTTYHPNIKRVLMAVIDRSSGECTELSQITGKIDAVVQDFSQSLTRKLLV